MPRRRHVFSPVARRSVSLPLSLFLSLTLTHSSFLLPVAWSIDSLRADSPRHCTTRIARPRSPRVGMRGSVVTAQTRLADRIRVKNTHRGAARDIRSGPLPPAQSGRLGNLIVAASRAHGPPFDARPGAKLETDAKGSCNMRKSRGNRILIDLPYLRRSISSICSRFATLVDTSKIYKGIVSAVTLIKAIGILWFGQTATNDPDKNPDIRD